MAETFIMSDSEHNIILLLGKIDGKLDSALTNIATHAEILEKHGQRISDLEKDRAKIVGAAVTVSLILSFLFQLVIRP